MAYYIEGYVKKVTVNKGTSSTIEFELEPTSDYKTPSIAYDGVKSMALFVNKTKKDYVLAKSEMVVLSANGGDLFTTVMTAKANHMKVRVHTDKLGVKSQTCTCIELL